MNIKPEYIAALEGHDNADEILALLSTDVDHCPAQHNGYETEAMDVDYSAIADSDFTHGAYNVAHTARWTSGQSLPSVGTLDSDTGHSDFIGPRAPALGERYRARFNAAKYYDAIDKAHKAQDRAAFPYLYDASGRRVNLTGRSWKSNMAKIRLNLQASSV
jgi:hypothetical protein